MFSAKDKQGKISIILIEKDGKEKVREAMMMQKGKDKRLYRYTQPESQAGIATLSLPGDVTWLYMPAFGKPKKISMLAKSQSFTGTDFSYEDMANSPYSERYTPTYLKTTGDYHLIELKPKSSDSKYAKIVATLHKTHGYPKSMEFYDSKGKKFKEATYIYEQIGKYWNASEVVMTDLEKKHSTKILLKEVKFDQGLTDDLFTVEKLKPVKVK
jgi:outer membrane lipoprotein-sorting protein